MCSREMKNSGIQWIGKIPKEWSIAPLGQYLKERNEKVSDKDFEPLSVTKQGVMKQLENVAKTNNNDNRKKVCKGDFVINSRSDRKQSCGLSELDGSVSVINIVLKNNGIEEKYLKYVLKNYGFAEEFYRWGSGIVADLWSTKYEKMKRIMIPIPDNGVKVGDYLDKKVSQIDDIISKQKSLIEKYKAYKQSLITETVTKGLNKNVPMKDSGIEWIGEIPSHWKIKSMKYLCSCNDDSLTNSEDENMCINYVDISSVTFESGIVNYEEMLFKNAPSRARRVTQYGDIIISTVRTYLKAIAIIPDDKRYIVSTGFAVIRAKYILNRYLDYFVKSEYFINLVSLYSKGISYPAIDSFDLMNIKILEPSIDEQEKIADFLDKKCNAINLAIAKKEQLIEKLESYKKSLIYECVTGKKEVN